MQMVPTTRARAAFDPCKKKKKKLKRSLQNFLSIEKVYGPTFS